MSAFHLNSSWDPNSIPVEDSSFFACGFFSAYRHDSDVSKYLARKKNVAPSTRRQWKLTFLLSQSEKVTVI